MTSSSENISAILALCAGNSPANGEFPSQRPVTKSFDVFFDQRLNKRLSKQSWDWWYETLSSSLWRHCNEPRPLTHLSQDISQTIYSDAFPWMKRLVFWLKLQWCLFPVVQLTTTQHCFWLQRIHAAPGGDELKQVQKYLQSCCVWAQIRILKLVHWYHAFPLWRHQMETFSALLVTGEFPAQRPVTRSFDVYFDLRLNKRLSKQSWGW